MFATASFGNITTPALRRVRRSEISKPAFNRPDPYAMCMACWIDFMRTDDRDLRAGTMKLASDAAADRDVYDEQRLADLKIGAAVNAMVDSLMLQHRWAIYKSQGIASVWRFPNANYEEVLLEARSELEKKLQKNVATRLFFL